MTTDQLSYYHLKVFLAVYRHKSAGAASAELGVTNSAISRSLKYLREVFSDQLFIRTANGYIPTEKATTISPRIEKIVSEYRQLFKGQSHFDPENFEGVFEIRAYDEFSYAVQDVIDNVIRKKAPKIRFKVRILTYNCVPELINGDVDFAVVYEGFDDKRLNFECFAHTDDIYLLLRSGHPLRQLETITTDDIAKYPLLEIDNYQDLSCPLLVDLCSEDGKVMQVKAYTESVASAARILETSDAVTVMCNQFTRQFADMMPGLSYIKIPPHILHRIINKRCEVRPIGNYVVYGNANLSDAFRWVKDELISGLSLAWDKAKSRPESTD